MLAGLFRSNQPAVLLAVPLVVLGLFAPSFTEPVTPPTGLMPLAAVAERVLGPAAWTHHVAGILLALVLSVQLASMVKGLELMDRRNHLVALLFPVLVAGMSSGAVYGPALLGMPLVLLALRRTWSMNNTGPVLGVLLDAGLLLGMAAMCFLPYAFVLVVVWSSVSVVRPFAWREYMIPLLGFALVFYLVWSLLYLTDATPWYPLRFIKQSSTTGIDLAPDAVRGAFYTVAILVLLVAIAAFMRGYSRSVMQAKNVRASFVAFAFSLGVVAMSIWFFGGTFPVVLVAVPASVFMGHALLAPKRPWLAELAAWSLFGLAIWVSWR